MTAIEVGSFFWFVGFAVLAFMGDMVVCGGGRACGGRPNKDGSIHTSTTNQWNVRLNLSRS